jgi:Flp pilus assembly protein TadD
MLVLGLAVAGCAGPLPGRPGANLPGEAELLSGKALFGEPVSASELPDKDLRGLDDEMRAFVQQAVHGAQMQDTRLERLLQAMLRSGLFSLDYHNEQTLTASETFHGGKGNCLAFTNLFVALAREARLKVSYQQVHVPPIWTGDADMAILNQHVNVRIEDTSGGHHPARHLEVDFNLPSLRGRYRQQVITDSHVDALFYNNLGAQAMRAGDAREAFIYFLKAISADEDVAATWSNLGVLYQRHDRPDHAESAFHRALQADRGHRPAMSNLSWFYEQHGFYSLAEVYRERIRSHQQRNPYYHLFLAEQAYADGRVDDALAAIDEAIRLHTDEHRFHYMRAVILARVGQLDASKASLEQARDHATMAQTRILYDRKLRALH